VSFSHDLSIGAPRRPGEKYFRNSGVIFLSISSESVPLQEYIIHRPAVRIIGWEISLEGRHVLRRDRHIKGKVITNVRRYLKGKLSPSKTLL